MRELIGAGVSCGIRQALGFGGVAVFIFAVYEVMILSEWC